MNCLLMDVISAITDRYHQHSMYKMRTKTNKIFLSQNDANTPISIKYNYTPLHFAFVNTIIHCLQKQISVESFLQVTADRIPFEIIIILFTSNYSNENFYQSKLGRTRILDI